MLAVTIDFANLLLAALLVGAIFGAWLLLDPKGLDSNTYVALQQQAIRTMNKTMPALGAVTIFATITAAVFAREDRARVYLLVAVVVCFVTIGLITRFLNQPINAHLMTWRVELPPPNWTLLRDAWWRWHCIRLATGVVGLCLLFVAVLRRGWSG